MLSPVEGMPPERVGVKKKKTLHFSGLPLLCPSSERVPGQVGPCAASPAG